MGCSDMANGVDASWEVEGVIQPYESVCDMLKAIAEKNEHDTGTFWCWDGRVRVTRSSTLSLNCINGGQNYPW